MSLTGGKFGRWTVIGPSARAGYWICVCECANTGEVRQYALNAGESRSCGCLRSEAAAQNIRRIDNTGTTHNLKHGHRKTGKYKTFSPTYSTWRGMIGRCTNPNHDRYAYYGGRGISVCERWRTFANFLTDMGERPSVQHSIDRYPNKDGNYEPKNCRWATKKEQANNRRKPCIAQSGIE